MIFKDVAYTEENLKMYTEENLDPKFILEGVEKSQHWQIQI